MLIIVRMHLYLNVSVYERYWISSALRDFLQSISYMSYICHIFPSELSASVYFILIDIRDMRGNNILDYIFSPLFYVS